MQRGVIDAQGQLQAATIQVEELGELFLINRDKVCMMAFVDGCRARTRSWSLPMLMLQIVACDQQRQATREALTALRKQQRASGGIPSAGKCWLNSPADGFLKLPSDTAVEHLTARESGRPNSSCIQAHDLYQAPIRQLQLLP
jgi:hypothetical protein